jgi:RHS repeat-associated protein
MRRTRLPFPRLWPFLFSCFFCGLVFTELARAHAVANPHYTFLTAKERDSESNLDYFGARYFSGAQGRFTGPDDPFADQNTSGPVLLA